jgi:hypothetical protein
MPPTTMPIVSPVPSTLVAPPTLRTYPAPANNYVSSSLLPLALRRLSLKPNSQSGRPHESVSDELGAIIDVAIDSFNQSSSWEEFVSKSRHTCVIAPGVQHIDHPAATILHQYKKFLVTVIMKTAQWPAAKIDNTIKRGPHKSVLKELLFLWQEFAAMMRKGQSTVLPDPTLSRNLKGIRISPVGIVPQRNRRPHTIVDYSLYDVNDDTAPIAPGQSMQFGRALH